MQHNCPSYLKLFKIVYYWRTFMTVWLLFLSTLFELLNIDYWLLELCIRINHIMNSNTNCLHVCPCSSYMRSRTERKCDIMLWNTNKNKPKSQKIHSHISSSKPYMVKVLSMRLTLIWQRFEIIIWRKYGRLEKQLPLETAAPIVGGTALGGEPSNTLIKCVHINANNSQECAVSGIFLSPVRDLKYTL